MRRAAAFWMHCKGLRAEARRVTVVETSAGGERGGNVLHLLCKVGDKVISCEGGGKRRGERVEEGREHGDKFPGVGGRRVDLLMVEGRFGC